MEGTLNGYLPIPTKDMKTKILLIIAVALFAVVPLAAQSKHKSKTQRVTVVLTESQGYKPDSFTLRKGVLAKVTFIRHGEGCGDVVVIPNYGVRRKLPMNDPVVVTFRPRETGTFGFSCGMNMYKGEIVVN